MAALEAADNTTGVLVGWPAGRREGDMSAQQWRPRACRYVPFSAGAGFNEPEVKFNQPIIPALAKAEPQPADSTLQWGGVTLTYDVPELLDLADEAVAHVSILSTFPFHLGVGKLMSIVEAKRKAPGLCCGSVSKYLRVRRLDDRGD